MKVILDTNVLLSAMISPYGAPDVIYRAWKAGHFDLVTAKVQLDEIRRASRYPKLKALIQPAKIGTMLNNLQRTLVLDSLDINRFSSQVSDPNDAFLLALASASSADYLITGDHRAGLIKLKHVGRTRIVTPTVFCSETFLK